MRDKDRALGLLSKQMQADAVRPLYLARFLEGMDFVRPRWYVRFFREVRRRAGNVWLALRGWDVE